MARHLLGAHRMMPRSPTAAPDPSVYLVAVDDTQAAAHVLEMACGLGAALGGAAELHIVHVLPPLPTLPTLAPLVTAAAAMPPDLLEAGRILLDRTAAAAAERFRGKIIGHLGAGEPWRQILQMASDLSVDLIVVGTAGRTGIARMALGSVAEQVVRHAGCPVLVVRPKDYHPHADQGIEPPCRDCVATQERTARAKLWCERHSTHHPHGRLHYELPPTFAMGSMNFRP